MNKKELTSRVAKQTGMTQMATFHAIEAVLEAIKVSLEEGEPVVLQGFGSFTLKEWMERNGVNPITKQHMTIPARKVVKFAPSKAILIK